jgi:hypothetical protein
VADTEIQRYRDTEIQRYKTSDQLDKLVLRTEDVSSGFIFKRVFLDLKELSELRAEFQKLLISFLLDPSLRSSESFKAWCHGEKDPDENELCIIALRDFDIELGPINGSNWRNEFFIDSQKLLGPLGKSRDIELFDYLDFILLKALLPTDLSAEYHQKLKLEEDILFDELIHSRRHHPTEESILHIRKCFNQATEKFLPHQQSNYQKFFVEEIEAKITGIQQNFVELIKQKNTLERMQRFLLDEKTLELLSIYNASNAITQQQMKASLGQLSNPEITDYNQQLLAGEKLIQEMNSLPYSINILRQDISIQNKEYEITIAPLLEEHRLAKEKKPPYVDEIVARATALLVHEHDIQGSFVLLSLLRFSEVQYADLINRQEYYDKNSAPFTETEVAIWNILHYLESGVDAQSIEIGKEDVRTLILNYFNISNEQLLIITQSYESKLKGLLVAEIDSPEFCLRAVIAEQKKQANFDNILNLLSMAIRLDHPPPFHKLNLTEQPSQAEFNSCGEFLNSIGIGSEMTPEDVTQINDAWQQWEDLIRERNTLTHEGLITKKRKITNLFTQVFDQIALKIIKTNNSTNFEAPINDNRSTDYVTTFCEHIIISLLTRDEQSNLVKFLILTYQNKMRGSDSQ